MKSENKDTIRLEARLFNGFADTSRLAILKTLIYGKKSVGEIVKITGLSQPNASAHLSCLKECGLVINEQDGKQVFYSLANKDIAKLLKLGQKILKTTSDNIYKCTRY